MTKAIIDIAKPLAFPCTSTSSPAEAGMPARADAVDLEPRIT
jgi:hypothetical protein